MPTEEFRAFDEIAVPDDRQQFFEHFDSELGDFRSSRLDEHHQEIAAIELHEGVPDDIRRQFDNARNLLLYAWFVYRFTPVAELHAYTTTEFED